MKQVIHTVIKANPDAIQLSLGQAKILQNICGKEKPSLVLRTDYCNVYSKNLKSLFCNLIDDPVLQAVRLDATCVVCNIFLLPNQEDLLLQCLKNVSTLKAQCDNFAMPLMVEPLVM